MDDLRFGVVTFQRHIFPNHKRLFQRLALGQSPRALLITCADSRVDPILITNSQAGHLFVDRNPGNFIPPYHGDNASESAGIEYALSALKIPNIIVCGHTDCGAMKGVLQPDKVTSMPAVAKWLTNGDAARQRVMALNLPEDEQLMALTEQNVLLQLEHLKTYPIVAERLESGHLQMAGWIYDIEHGQVREYDPETRTFDVIDV